MVHLSDVEAVNDCMAQVFLKTPYFGTLVIEISCTNDRASYLYEVVAATAGQESLSAHKLRITANGLIINDCSDVSLKDMGINHGSTLECSFVLLGGSECCGRYLVHCCLTS